MPGREVAEILRLVTGNIVQARNIGRDIQAGFRSVVGGRAGVYSEMLAEARFCKGESGAGPALLGFNAAVDVTEAERTFTLQGSWWDR